MTLGRLTSVDSNENGWFKMIQKAVKKEEPSIVKNGTNNVAAPLLTSPKTLVSSAASNKSSKAAAETAKKRERLEAPKSRPKRTILPGSMHPVLKMKSPKPKKSTLWWAGMGNKSLKMKKSIRKKSTAVLVDNVETQKSTASNPNSKQEATSSKDKSIK